MFRWTQERIGYMNDASEYGDFHRRLAAALAPQMKREWRLCDAGCGLGGLSVELAAYVRTVTAADVSAPALAALRAACARREIRNVETLCIDVFTLPPAQSYDAMTFCFFGSLDQTLSLIARQCRGTAFLIKRNDPEHRFSVGAHPIDTGYEAAMRVLRQRDIPFAAQELALEFGQPFRSLAAARRFFETYSRDGDKTCITDAFLRARLVETGRTDFPLYLPQMRHLGILRVESRDIPKEETR